MWVGVLLEEEKAFASVRVYSCSHQSTLFRSRDMNHHGEVKRDINPGDYIVVFSMFSRPCTPFFDLLQHKYKELWMEQQRALTAAKRVEKKKVIMVQQCFPLLCTALLPGIRPHCPTPRWTDFSQPRGGLSAGKTSSQLYQKAGEAERRSAASQPR